MVVSNLRQGCFRGSEAACNNFAQIFVHRVSVSQTVWQTVVTRVIFVSPSDHPGMRRELFGIIFIPGSDSGGKPGAFAGAILTSVLAQNSAWNGVLLVMAGARKRS